MKKGTAVCIIIMVASFVLSMIFLFLSAGLYIASGTRELADRIRTGRWDDIKEKIEFVSVNDDEVKVDLPGVHVLVDDLGVDVYVVGVHVDMRDDEDGRGVRRESEETKADTTEATEAAAG
ncbi:MAG: hypothetical protein IKX04_06110 [Clostridiales bacterium]|nr:hypothetical protein [Clostridiales bacterium]